MFPEILKLARLGSEGELFPLGLSSNFYGPVLSFFPRSPGLAS